MLFFSSSVFRTLAPFFLVVFTATKLYTSSARFAKEMKERMWVGVRGEGGGGGEGRERIGKGAGGWGRRKSLNGQRRKGER